MRHWYLWQIGLPAKAFGDTYYQLIGVLTFFPGQPLKLKVFTTDILLEVANIPLRLARISLSLRTWSFRSWFSTRQVSTSSSVELRYFIVSSYWSEVTVNVWVEFFIEYLFRADGFRTFLGDRNCVPTRPCQTVSLKLQNVKKKNNLEYIIFRRRNEKTSVELSANPWFQLKPCAAFAKCFIAWHVVLVSTSTKAPRFESWLHTNFPINSVKLAICFR